MSFTTPFLPNTLFYPRSSWRETPVSGCDRSTSRSRRIGADTPSTSAASSRPRHPQLHLQQFFGGPGGNGFIQQSVDAPLHTVGTALLDNTGELLGVDIFAARFAGRQGAAALQE
jgi:hypothetical protein